KPQNLSRVLPAADSEPPNPILAVFFKQEVLRMTFHVLRSAKLVQVVFLSTIRSTIIAALWALIVVALSVISSGAFGNSYAAITATGYRQDVSAGGRAHTSKQGKKWSSDQPYSPGSWGFIGGDTG